MTCGIVVLLCRGVHMCMYVCSICYCVLESNDYFYLITNLLVLHLKIFVIILFHQIYEMTKKNMKYWLFNSCCQFYLKIWKNSHGQNRISYYPFKEIIFYHSFCRGSRDVNLTALLDQKNYLEEHNRHLTSQLTGLQARLRALEDGNSKMKEEVRKRIICTYPRDFSYNCRIHITKGEVSWVTHFELEGFEIVVYSSWSCMVTASRWCVSRGLLDNMVIYMIFYIVVIPEDMVLIIHHELVFL